MLLSAKDFGSDMDFSITGVSYIDTPLPHTALYVSRKLEEHLVALATTEMCLVFVEKDMVVPKNLLAKHSFVFCENPAREYGHLACELWQQKQKSDRQRPMVKTDAGYFMGQNVSLGKDTIIEPGALIGHDVTIGAKTIVRTGAVIRDACVGRDCIIGENAVVGGDAFTTYRDENDDLQPLHSLGKVVVDDGVSVGALTVICRGTAGATHIGALTKLDTHVYVAHDIQCGRNVTITTGVSLGGFSVIAEGAYIGMNAAVINRISVGAHSVVGMGSVVTKDVPPKQTVWGVPAKEHQQNT